MTDLQLLQLLKRELADCRVPDSSGKCKSSLDALDLVQEFRQNIERKVINDFLTGYKSFTPDHIARSIAAEKVIRDYQKQKTNENKRKNRS